MESTDLNEQEKLISSILQKLKGHVSESLTDNNLLKVCNNYLLDLEVSLHNEPLKADQFVNNFNKLLLTFQSLQNLE